MKGPTAPVRGPRVGHAPYGVQVKPGGVASRPYGPHPTPDELRLRMSRLTRALSVAYGLRHCHRREPAAKRKSRAHPAPAAKKKAKSQLNRAHGRALVGGSAPSLAAALQDLGLTTDAGPMPGVAHDSSSGHEKDPWRSIVRERQNDDFALPVSRFATSAAATRRTLRAIREHPTYVTTGQFRLTCRKTDTYGGVGAALGLLMCAGQARRYHAGGPNCEARRTSRSSSCCRCIGCRGGGGGTRGSF